MRCFFILLIFLICEGGLQADTTSSSRIAAIVNKEVITKADLMNRLRFAAISSGLEPTAENLERMKPQMLRVLIDEKLQLKVGKDHRIEVTEEHINQAIRDIEENNGMPQGAIANMMKENNIPYDTIKNQIKAQLTWLIYIREKYPLKTLEDQINKKRLQDISPSLQIADWEIDQELKLQKEKETKIQYHLAEIVLPVDRPEQEGSVKNNLNHLIEELQKGAHFSSLAQQFSQSATSAQGGDMGWMSEDQLEPEVKEALTSMQPGQLSNPIKTSQGYTLIAFIERKLPGTEGEPLMTLQQVLMPFPQNPTEDQVQAILVKANEVSRKAKSCPELERYAKEKYPSTKEHLAKNDPIASFPEPLQKLVATLEINKASEPLLTQEGVIVMMVCEKKTLKKEEMTREDAELIIAGRKHNLLARRELRDLRRHAFIDVRM